MVFRLLLLLIVLGALVVTEGCGGRFANTYDREIDLTKRAALDKLSEKEKESLLRESHPILLQLADPALRGLLRLFAQLPDEQIRELHDKHFLKWRYTDLDAGRRDIFEQVLMMNLQMIRENVGAEKEKLLDMLANCDVGFAVVQIPSSGERVVSCYVLWPDKVFPSWITVANSKAAMSEEAATAHLTKLSMLKTLTHSSLPPAIAKQTAVEHGNITARKPTEARRVRTIVSQPIQYQPR